MRFWDLVFFAWCWWPRESMLQGSSTLSEFCTSLSKVLTLCHCVKVKQRYHTFILSRVSLLVVLLNVSLWKMRKSSAPITSMYATSSAMPCPGFFFQFYSKTWCVNDGVGGHYHTYVAESLFTTYIALFTITCYVEDGHWSWSEWYSKTFDEDDVFAVMVLTSGSNSCR